MSPSRLFACRRYDQQISPAWPSSCSSSSPALSASSASSWRRLPSGLVSRWRPGLLRPIRKQKTSVRLWRQWRRERRRRWGHLIIFVVMACLLFCSHFNIYFIFSISPCEVTYISVVSSGPSWPLGTNEGRFSSHIGWITLNSEVNVGGISLSPACGYVQIMTLIDRFLQELDTSYVLPLSAWIAWSFGALYDSDTFITHCKNCFNLKKRFLKLGSLNLKRQVQLTLLLPQLNWPQVQWTYKLTICKLKQWGSFCFFVYVY